MMNRSEKKYTPRDKSKADKMVCSVYVGENRIKIK